MRIASAVVLLLVSSTAMSAEAVITLHGLSRTERAMQDMAEHLDAAGFAVTNLGYPSTTATVEDLVESHLAPAVAAHADAERLHFVTHSMGGILVRELLRRGHPPNLGRVVMIAPPNAGSELVDTLGPLPPFGWINGPAGHQLGTDAESLPNRLGPADFPLGVIAGSRSWNPLYSWLIDGDDDGKVSVARTRLAGMADHITLHHGHTFIQSHADTAEQAIHFLRHGQFRR